MSVLCGYAANGETGHARGNKPGDQTGREVKTANWYQFGQNYVIRFKNRETAKKAAEICKEICNNKHVGYDQNERTTLFDALKAVNWDPSKLKKNVECDCSALMAVVCNAVGIKVNKNWWTGNMVQAARSTGKFEILSAKKYLSSSKYLKTGDMIVNTSKHVIMALENGSKVKSTSGSTNSGLKSISVVAKEVIKGNWGNGSERKKRLEAAGYDYAAVQKRVNELKK